MGLILDEYYGYKEEYREYISKRAYRLLEMTKNEKIDMLEPTQEQRDKYFVDGLEELSLAVFNLLHSKKEYYIMSYANAFKVNRKAAGFKTKEDIIHYAMWVVEDFLNSKNDRINQLEELKKNSMGKSAKSIAEDVFAEEVLREEIERLERNIKSLSDIDKKIALIDILSRGKTLSYHLLSNFKYYKMIDDIYVALEKIPDVETFNIPPAPIGQNLREFTMI